MENTDEPRILEDTSATDADRYPRLNKVFAEILGCEDLPEEGVEHIYVHCFPSGEASAQLFPPRSDESVDVYIPPGTTG